MEGLLSGLRDKIDYFLLGWTKDISRYFFNLGRV